MNIDYVDICVGLAWGDEGKGKIVSQLASSGEYDYVCRWSGGNNAGHTIYVDGIKYSTHLIPSGVFYGIKSIIGPGCVVNIRSFFDELRYLNDNGFDTSLIKISPKAHIITDDHIIEDKKKYANSIGTTAKGIGPCYRDKYARVGSRVSDYEQVLEGYIWDERLEGKILCEGAQGTWLDIDYGNYPYVTSSHCLPFSACNLGFAPQKIRKIIGALKIYDTRVGLDPEFPEELDYDAELARIGDIGKEYGTTTGRARRVNYLNMDKLLKALELTGTTEIIISKIDVLESELVKVFKFYYKNVLRQVESIEEMKEEINMIIKSENNYVKEIIYSGNPDKI